MKTEQIITIFEALSQEGRLKIFRLMVEHSQTGITPTEIYNQLGSMAKNTLSFHLNILTQAGLCTYKKNGKSLIYKPNCKLIKEAAEFLLKDCCEGECQC